MKLDSLNTKVPLIGSYPDHVFSKYDPAHLALLENIIAVALVAHTDPVAIWDEIMGGLKEAKLAITSTAFIFDRIWDHLPAASPT